MIKNLLRISLLTLALGAFTAQAAPPMPLPLAFGLTYNRATKNHQNGWGMKLQVDLGPRFRLEPEMMYFAEHDDVSTLDLNLNLHWRIPLFSHFGVYPFAGVSYSHWGYNGPNASRWGCNLGCGAELFFARRWSGFTETRLQIVSHETQPIFTFGLKYHIQ